MASISAELRQSLMQSFFPGSELTCAEFSLSLG